MICSHIWLPVACMRSLYTCALVLMYKIVTLVLVPSIFLPPFHGHMFCSRYRVQHSSSVCTSKGSTTIDAITVFVQHCSLDFQHFLSCFVFFYMHLSSPSCPLSSTIDLKQLQKDQRQLLLTLLLLASKSKTHKFVSLSCYRDALLINENIILTILK